ncbi:MAG: hypothetical protein ACHREM_33145, partial [Polyangiales bacterium]
MKRAVVVALALACAAACGPGARDIKQWEQTADDGPAQLAQLVRDDKARIDARRDAAIALTRLERRERRVGLDILLDALGEMPEASRSSVVAAMTPELVRKTALVRPLTGVDPSLAAKDAAYALLSRGLVADAKHKAELTSALLAWTQSSTLARLDDSSQRYSCQQAIRLLGAPAVRGLPELLPAARRIDRVVALILEVGEPATKDAARAALVAFAREVASPMWKAEQLPIIEQANLDAHVPVTPKQLAEQLARFRAESLARVFGSMKQIGGPSVLEHLLAVAGDASESAEVRALALGALETHVGELAAAQIDRLSSVAGDDATPDLVRDAAFARIAELSSPTTRLYAFFASKGWRPRYAAALVVLRSLAGKDVGEFMDHLPEKPTAVMDAR